MNNYDDSGSFKLRIYPNDKIKLRPINYRKESVLIVGETGTQKSIQINHSTRPTLSDMLFSRNNLNLITTDFRQIYVIRETKSIHNAYHLDITDPVRISLAGKFEMRPG